MAPKILLVYRADSRFGKVQTPELVLPNGIKVKVELLAEGQQFVADGTHPDTGQPYIWTGGSPEDVPVAELPVITEAQARNVINEIEGILRAVGAREKKKPSQEHKPNGSGGGFFCQVNIAALANIEAWIRALFPRARFQPGTGAWRISSKDLGRDLEEDLSIHPDGIQDFGDEVGLSPIDLVMRHSEFATAIDAALWLCGRLAIDPASLGYTGKRPKGAQPAAAGHDVDPVDIRVWDAADVFSQPIPPRQWILGNTFCKQFISSLLGSGAVGKTAVRIVQALSVAIGHSLTGEFVHKRCRVLFLSFEDGRTELKRRLAAAMIHHSVSAAQVQGWLFFANISGHRLIETTGRGDRVARTLEGWLRQTILELKVELVVFDPFIKTHGVAENDNTGIDSVCVLLARLAVELDVAVDYLHHVRKGPPDPGNADIGRGASAAKDAARLVYTLNGMTKEDAQLFNVTSEALRRSLVRQDTAKQHRATRRRHRLVQACGSTSQ